MDIVFYFIFGIIAVCLVFKRAIKVEISVTHTHTAPKSVTIKDDAVEEAITKNDLPVSNMNEVIATINEFMGVGVND